ERVPVPDAVVLADVDTGEADAPRDFDQFPRRQRTVRCTVGGVTVHVEDGSTHSLIPRVAPLSPACTLARKYINRKLHFESPRWTGRRSRFARRARAARARRAG